jgi:aerobic-type carbon monoxide dehydrogenase small subunit (CoxS/CutS family)
MSQFVTQPIKFYVNDQAVECQGDEADMSLLDFLHERLDKTGTKFGCGIGVCRACTVATRNAPGALLEKTLACSTPVSFMQGMHVYTVEGLAKEQQLAPLQQAFLDHFSFQCGYCAPGFLMAASTMLDHMKSHAVSKAGLDEFILTWVGGNICRCTGYVRYLDAIRQVALPLTRE